MASIFKRIKAKNEPYTIQYKDHTGKRRTVKGFTDKGLTEQLAGKLESEVRLRTTGMIDPIDDRFAEHKQSPIQNHLSDFEASLKDFSPKYAKMTMSQVRKIVAGCGISKLAGVEGEQVEQYLQSLRENEGIASQTYNHYLDAANAFFNWCVRTKRIIANPLRGISRQNVQVDIRRKRRALTADEIGKLVKAARMSNAFVEGYSGEERAHIYLLSYFTGLRRKEIASLTPKSFELDANPPTLTVEAKFSKHRRKDVLPLHGALVSMLREWLVTIPSNSNLFPHLATRYTAGMVRNDLQRAGIPYITEKGVADFHAAGRHSYITELLRNGASLPEARELARHSNVNMTMRYTHIGIDDQAKAIAKLPKPVMNDDNGEADCYAPPESLHGRCKPAVAVSPRLASNGTETETQSCPKPCDSNAFDAASPQLASSDKSTQAARITAWLGA